MKDFFNKSYLISAIIGILLTGSFAYLKMSSSDTIQSFRQRIEYILYDVKSTFFASKNNLKSDHVVILDIDEKSLQQYGRWPWGRDLLSEIITKLWANQATVVASDILFSEPQVNPVDRILKLNLSQVVIDELSKKKGLLDSDSKLGRSLAMGDSILPYVLFKKVTFTKGQLPRSFQVLSKNELHNTVTPMTGFLTSLPVLMKQSFDSGFISYFRDKDGVTRRLPLLLSYNNKLYYSFCIAILKAYLLEDNLKVLWGQSGHTQFIRALKLGDRIIPTNLHGEAFIPFYGDRYTIPTISVYKLLHNKFPKNYFTGKIVILGTSAIGLGDLQATPVSPVFPGVEIQANVIQGILDRHLAFRPLWLQNDEVVVLLVLGLFLSLLLPALSSKYQSITCFVSICLLLAIDFGLWFDQFLVVHSALIILMVFSIGIFNFMYGFIFTQAHERLLKKAFARYIPPDQVKQISKDPTNFNLEGQEREMSVLFSDIRGFTSISELLTANELKKLLNEFFTPMTKDIFECNGTIDKYVGDMIMAFWSAPLENEDHANDVLRCALKMLQSQQRLSEEFVAKGLPAFKMGIGINSGIMNVGDMGSEYRQNYTIIGDNVNLGSRLESLTKHYAVDCLVSEFTVDLQTDYYCRRLDKVQVKGRDEGIFIFEPLCLLQEVTEEDQRMTELLYQGQDYYYQQQWAAALNAFTELEKEGFNAAVCSIYQQRIEQFKGDPPLADWDGSFKLNFK